MIHDIYDVQVTDEAEHPREQLSFHSIYDRSIKETGEEVRIHMMIRHECKKTSPTGKDSTIAVLPDSLY